MRSVFLVLASLAACDKPKLELAFEPTCDGPPDRFVETTRERVNEKGADTAVFVRGRRVIVSMPRDTPRDIAAELKALVVRFAVLDVKIIDEDARDLADRVSTYPDANDITTKRDVWRTQLGEQTDTYVVAPSESALRTLFDKHPELAPPVGRVVAFGRTGDDRGWRTYVLVAHAELAPATIERVIPSYDAETDHPTITLDLTPDGARQMIDLTSRTVGKRIAFVLDGKVKGTVAITSAVPDGHMFTFHVDGPDATARERLRDELVAVLRVGSLPCPLRAVDH